MFSQPAISPLLSAALLPVSMLYSAVVRGRNAYYSRVGSAVRSAGVPVISVGNITVGGTGKTPMVIEIVRRLRERGRRPAILTRGYGASGEQVADEVLEYRDAAPDVPVVVGPDRVAGARAARLRHGADCLVLDDGFQHRRLGRDLDVVLIDALDPWGGGRVLPAGRLREPLGGLARAGLFIVTRANQVEPSEADEIEAALRRLAPGAPLARSAIEPVSILELDGSESAPDVLAADVVLPVCGLGNPRTFVRLVERLAAGLCEPVFFADHHRYDRADVRGLLARARRQKAARVVTTRKDWVKLAPLWPRGGRGVGTMPLSRLDVRCVLIDPGGAVERALERIFVVNT